MGCSCSSDVKVKIKGKKDACLTSVLKFKRVGREIFSFLSLKELVKVSATCAVFYEHTGDKYILSRLTLASGASSPIKSLRKASMGEFTEYDGESCFTAATKMSMYHFEKTQWDDKNDSTQVVHLVDFVSDEKGPTKCVHLF